MATPPQEPWYGRYWAYTNRPYPGCGCAYIFFLVLVLWFVLSLVYPALAIWQAS